MSTTTTFPGTFNDFFTVLSENFEDENVDTKDVMFEKKVISKPIRLGSQHRRNQSFRQFRRHGSDLKPKICPLPLPVSCMTLTNENRDTFESYVGRKRSSSLATTQLVSLTPIYDQRFRSDSLCGSKVSLQRSLQLRKTSMPNTGSVKIRPTLSEIRKLKSDRYKQHLIDDNNNDDLNADANGDTNNNDSISDTERADVEYYRLRSFSITAHGDLANLGDLLKSRRSKSIGSVSSVNSCFTRFNRGRLNSTPSSQLSSNTDLSKEDGSVPSYKVGILGASGIGKTSLTFQFTTSEYICAYDTSLDDEYGQKTVSVMLNGQETELDIIDLPANEISVESFCASYNVDIFVIVYSIVDSASFKAAEDIILYLWKQDYMSSRAVILVGNKADLERKREVPKTIGRKLANSVGCKFIETSSGLDHNVDKLLVGILAQIKLNPKRIKNFLNYKKKQFGSNLVINRRLLKQIFGFKRKACSCENLYVL